MSMRWTHMGEISLAPIQPASSYDNGMSASPPRRYRVEIPLEVEIQGFEPEIAIKDVPRLVASYLNSLKGPGQ